MSWLRRRKTDRSTLDEHMAAHKALHKAEDDLREAQERNQEIVTVVRRAKRYGEANNFAQLIRDAMGGAK